ncbi:ROK family transcriptional regulator [Actinocorallia aurea]
MHANPTQAPVRHGAMRAQNLGLVLGEVARGGPLTRAALAELTGLTKTTVSRLVADLLDAGLVAEAPAVSGGERGRPGVEVSLSGGRVAALGLEVNVAYLAACVVDLTREVRVRKVIHRDNRAERPEDVLSAVRALGDEAASEASDLLISGTVLAIPGPVGRGRVHNAPNLGWRDVDVAALFGRPVTVENEANMAALGELEFGGAPSDFLYVSGETGVGAGLVSGGSLYRGVLGVAGELGHVAVASEGPACRCGATGCLEVYAGRDALPSPEALSSGDPSALEACRRAGHALGVALASAVNLLDPGTIVLGGIYAPVFGRLAPAVREVLAERLARLRPTLPDLVPSATGPDAAVLGAAGQILQRVITEPMAYAGKATP